MVRRRFAFALITALVVHAGCGSFLGSSDDDELPPRREDDDASSGQESGTVIEAGGKGDAGESGDSGGDADGASASARWVCTGGNVSDPVDTLAECDFKRKKTPCGSVTANATCTSGEQEQWICGACSGNAPYTFPYEICTCQP